MRNLIFILSFFSVFQLFASGSCDNVNCTEYNPFCANTTYNFPNVTGTTAPDCPDYACMSTQPNPVWYYMKVSQSGTFQMNIAQTTGPNGTGTGLDVDYAMWGPYPDLQAGCDGVNNGDAPAQSSYDPQSIETVGIGLPGGDNTICDHGNGATTPSAAIAGQYYVFCITNYDGSAGYITFNQTGGTGSADCSIVTPCGISSVSASPTACNASGQYDVSGSVSFTSPPATGTLTITNSAGGTVTVSAPFASPYNYSFTGISGTGATETITATFSDDATCTNSTTYTAPTCGCTVTASNSGPVCEGTTFGLTASNVAGATSYTWSGPSGYSSTTQNPTGISAPTNGSYTYTVSVSSSSGTCTSSTTLTVNPLPATPLSSVVAPTCSAAGTASLTNYAGTNTYAFTPSGPTVGGTGAISGMTAGTNYTVTSTLGSCTSTASAAFSVAAQLVTPATPTVSTTAPTCSAAGTATLTNFDGSVTYTFSPTGPSVAPSGAISGLVAGTSYTLSSYNGSCTSTSSAFSIADQLPTPSTPSVSVVAETCSADGTATVSNYSGSYTYVFTPAGPSVGVAGVISGMTYGTSYTVTATDGVCTSSASSNFSINQQLPVPVLTLVSQTVCSPLTVNLTSASVASTDIGTLSYYSDAAYATPVSNPSAVGAGTYYIQAVSGTCSTNGTLTVTVTTTPTLTLNDQSICSPSTVDLTNSAVASTDVGTMAYYTDASLSNPVSNPSSVGAGAYYLQATNGSCTFSGVLNVTVTTTPTLTLVSQSICTPYTVNLTSASVASTDIGTMAYYTDAALTTPVTTPTAVGNGVYYVEATNGICSSNGSLTVTVTTTPTLTLHDSTVCSPATVDLTSPDVSSTDVGTLAYYTDAALTSPVATPTAAGNGAYYVVATNGSCTFSGIVNVTVLNLPVIAPLVQTPACGTYTLPAITGTNINNESYWTGTNQTGIQYMVGDAVTSSMTLYMFAGVSGCSDEAPVSITVNPIPTVSAFANGATYCQGDVIQNVEATVTGSPAWTITYTLDGAAQTVTGSTSPISLGNTPGTYELTSISDANCSGPATQTQTILVNPLPAAPATSADSTYCSTWTLVDMTASGGAGTFNWYDDAALTNNLGSGATYLPSSTSGAVTYYVTETLNNCEGPASAIVITINQCDIVIPTAFTPNGDNMNDFWEIVYLDDVYAQSQVAVYNRWGEKVYESEKGKYASNPWNGMFNNKLLPVGSYFYILDLGDGSDKRTGTVTIILTK